MRSTQRLSLVPDPGAVRACLTVWQCEGHIGKEPASRAERRFGRIHRETANQQQLTRDSSTHDDFSANLAITDAGSKARTAAPGENPFQPGQFRYCDVIAARVLERGSQRVIPGV